MVLLAALFFAVAGFVETRLLPGQPAVACMTWFLGLMALVIGITTAPVTSALRLVFALSVVVVGVGLIGRYYSTHGSKSAGE